MKRMLMVLAVVGLVGGCSMQSRGTILGPLGDAIPGSSAAVSLLSLVQGTWTGSQTATVGLSGPLSVTFTQPPVADANVAGTVSVTLSTGTFNGTFTGTIDHIVITASNGTSCGYVAIGTLNQAGTQITGTYTGTGEGACSTKAGTFVLNGTSFVPPPPPAPLLCSTTYYSMQNGNANAKQNKCTNTGGVWLGEFDVPGTPIGIEHDVCRFTPNPPGNPGNDMALILSVPIACPVQ